MKTVHGACPHDCPDTCAWQVTVDDSGRAIALAGTADHPFTRGALCSKLKRYPARVYHADRILHPLRRRGAKGAGEFERVSWDDALDEMATQLERRIARHGPLTAMPASFAGTIGLLQRFAGDPFFARLGATGVDRQICGNVAWAGAAMTAGSGSTILPDDLVHSRYIVLWGTNTAATNLHLWGGAIRVARRAGARVVVIDPIRTPTAAHADWHLQITPGSDAALALGLMHVIVRDSLIDHDYVARHTLGFAALRERVADYPPARVAALTGIAADDIERFAREYATTPPAVIRLMVGMERYSNGAQAFRAIAALPALIGAWRERGGGLCHFIGALHGRALDLGTVFAPRDLPPPARTVHLAQLGRTLTDAHMAPPITWLMVYNLNPVVTMPNQNLVRRGLAREDLYTVVHEHFMTDTAKYADLVLPATMQFEHWDLMAPWGQHYLAINEPAIAPQGEAIANTELFRRLSRRLGFGEDYLLASDEDRIRRILGTGHPWLDGITFDALRERGWAPLGIPDDYRPHADGGFATPSGKCEFHVTAREQAGADPLPTFMPIDDAALGPDGARPLRLVSAKVAQFLNSEYVNLPHKGTESQRPRVHLHPADAAVRGIVGGTTVRIFNALGEVHAEAAVDDTTAAGVVYLPFSWWPGSMMNGQSANALTPDGLSDLGIGSNAFDARVEVAPLA